MILTNMTYNKVETYNSEKYFNIIKEIQPQ